MDSFEIAGCAALAAVSAVFQIVHVGYPTPWGMWIDVVAIPWILAFFLFGWRGALTVSVLGALIITLVAPTTWLGAYMKWIASFPMWFMLWVWVKTFKLKLKDFSKLKIILVCICLAIILRGLIVVPVNYYFAIPLWTGLIPEVAMQIIPWYIIVGLNIIQGTLEVLVAWLLMFRFGLMRFSLWG